MQTGVFGSAWAVASPHMLATEAGAVAFERGGNAIDAAVTTAITLAVVYPHMCGVGGDLFALVQQPAGEAIAVNASGRAPSAADVAVARAAGDGRMPERGPHSVTIPGAVSGWETLHRVGGVLPWRDLFTQAIALAHGGVPVARSLAGLLADPGELSETSDAIRHLFAPGGIGLAAGASVRQPALGVTLQRIAAEGSGVLYGGEVGDRYAAGLREAGVPIGLEDMAAHRADLGTPLATRYRDADVLIHPPNSQGFVLLEILATIERLGLDPDPCGPDAGTIACVFRAAARDRDLHLADPDTMRVHPSTLLDDGHLAALGDEVRAGLATGSGAALPQPSGDTIALVTADGDGRAVSLIQSLFSGFGSGILEPVTGIVAQNRGGCFTLDRDHANVLAPGKRPAHTLMPVLVRRQGRLGIVTGTMGGYAQPQINAMNLLRTLDLRMAPHETVAAPRWLVGGMDPLGDRGPWVIAESDVPNGALDALQRTGFRVDMVAKEDDAVGHAHLIRAGSAGFDVAGDPRSDGGALAG